MIINFFGIPLQVIDNGDGTFSVKPVDAVADKQLIRDEISRLKDIREEIKSRIASAASERDYHAERRTYFIDLRNAAVVERDDVNLRIDELRAFIVSAGDPDPGA